jgi:hypothetical protein
MSDALEALRELQHALAFIRELRVNPWAAAILAALIAAFMEQRRVRNRVAPFTKDHMGVKVAAPR